LKYNAGTIEIVKVPKMKPRVRYLNSKYHHFGDEVRRGANNIYHTRNIDQIAEDQQAQPKNIFCTIEGITRWKFST
jgi:hypothetical protein